MATAATTNVASRHQLAPLTGATPGRGRTSMADINVRTMAFDWPDDLPVLPIPSDISLSCELVALSFTLPYLEPYLIRTMSLAGKDDIDPALASDLRSFSKQEAQHHRNHSRINNIVRSKLPEDTAAALRRLEDDLANDYRRFTTTKSLRYNLAYAEGFEAMTLALAVSTGMAPRRRSRTSHRHLRRLRPAVRRIRVPIAVWRQVPGSFPVLCGADGRRARVRGARYAGSPSQRDEKHGQATLATRHDPPLRTHALAPIQPGKDRHARRGHRPVGNV